MAVYFALGSNLGDRWANLRLGVSVLAELDPALGCSPVYETEPVGGPEQGRYLNCVVAVDSESEPYDLLAKAHLAEQLAGRVRTVRDGPRTLDVDILLIDGYASDDPELTVPHPRMYERAFVLAPLEDLAPRLVPPGWREVVDQSGVRRVGALLGPFARPAPLGPKR